MPFASYPQNISLPGTLAFGAGGAIQTNQFSASTTPVVSSGVAFIPSNVSDSTVYFQINAAAAGSYTLSLGPSAGNQTAVGTAVAMVIGSDALVTLRVPATWRVVLTLTTVTLASTTVVTG